MNKLVLTVAAASLLSLTQAQELEIFSWWAGDEGPALEALIDLYEEQNPDAEVVNATVTGGAGVNARAVLKTRMLGGDPPDSFQVHAGQELIGTWVAAERMEDLSSLFEEEGWNEAFPEGLLNLISTDAGTWSVPVNVHRSNVMWFVPAKLEEWGISAPTSWDEFLEACPTLQEQGVTPLVVAEPWTQQHLWESVALAVLGPDNYDALWSGELAFDSEEATAVWETFGEVMACTNDDAAGLSWQQATDRVVSGEAAFNIMGDWAAGYLTTTLGLEPETDFSWAASPGTEGTFMLLADSFGLPVGAPDRDATMAWLRLVGSQQGQDTFNPLKGSISPRLDSDPSIYNAYSQSAYEDYTADRQVGSLAHGAVANETFMSEFANVLEGYITSGDAAQAGAAAQELATRTGVGGS